MRGALAVVVMLAGAPAFAGWFGIDGNGKLQTQPREAAGFSRVSCTTSIDCEVRGGDFRVEVTADSNLLQYLETRVDGDTLVVRSEENLRLHRDAKVVIHLPRLDAAKASGSGDLRIADVPAGDELLLRTSGSGDVKFDGSAEALAVETHGSGDVTVRLRSDLKALEIEMTGSGDVRVEGRRAEYVSAELTGSGDLEAAGLTTHSGRFTSTGSGDIRCDVDGGQAEFRSSGSGDIVYSGEARARIHKSGSGSIRHL